MFKLGSREIKLSVLVFYSDTFMMTFSNTKKIAFMVGFN